jgi:hypothetical protein
MDRLMDLQSIGRQLVFLRKENERLKKENIDLHIAIDGLKLTIERIMLEPSTHTPIDD